MARIASIFAPVLGFICTLTIINQGNAYDDPGIKIKICPQGLDLAKNLVEDVVKKEVQSANIPDLSGGNYRITNIELTSFNIGTTTFSTTSPNVFTVTINGASLSAQADYRVWTKIWFATLSNSGSISASASGVSITQSISISRNNNCKPTFTPKSCQVSISSFDVYVSSGNWGTLFNYLIDIFEDVIKRELEYAVCNVITQQLNLHLSKVTNDFNVKFPFVFGTDINLGLVRPPVAGTNTFTVCLKGRSCCKSNPFEDFPFGPHYIPPFYECSSTKAAQIQISEYAINTLFYSMRQCNRFRLAVSSAQISSALGFDLTAGKLAEHVPAFERFLNSSPIEIVLNALSAPKASINASGIYISGPFSLKVNVVLANGRKPQVLSINVNVMIGANVQVTNDVISGSITSIKAVATSSTGFPVNYINKIFDAVLPSLIIPAINEVAKSGFKIPDLYGYSHRNLALTLKQNTIEISSDFS